MDTTQKLITLDLHSIMLASIISVVRAAAAAAATHDHAVNWVLLIVVHMCKHTFTHKISLWNGLCRADITVIQSFTNYEHYT